MLEVAACNNGLSQVVLSEQRERERERSGGARKKKKKKETIMRMNE